LNGALDKLRTLNREREKGRQEKTLRRRNQERSKWRRKVFPGTREGRKVVQNYPQAFLTEDTRKRTMSGP